MLTLQTAKKVKNWILQLALSVDEDGPNETQPETMPVSLKRAIEVVVPRTESKENARGKFPPKLI